MKSYPATDPAANYANGARPPVSLYLAGPFSMGYVDFFTFLIPLYGISLGLDASEIGVLVGARSILALFLSIHIGVLMDRFGTRAVTLVFVWTGMVLAPLFPLASGFWALFSSLSRTAALISARRSAVTLAAAYAACDPRRYKDIVGVSPLICYTVLSRIIGWQATLNQRVAGLRLAAPTR